MRLHSILIGLFIACLSTALFAQDEKWYQVEVIVFENKSGDTAWPSEGVLNFTNAIDVRNLNSEKFKSLAASKYTLLEAKAKIQKRYHLITHQGWCQILDARNDAIAVRLSGQDLQGIVRLSGNKFLHVDSDFILNKNAQNYRMKDSSRIKANELHYIDHPLYGILISVTPLSST